MLEIIESFQNLEVATIRTACMITVSGTYRASPAVSEMAFPPDRPMTSSRNHIWFQRGISFIIPLLCQIRLQRRKIIKALQYNTISTIGTATASYPVWCSGFPGMSLWICPPDFFMPVAWNLIWFYPSIFIPIPFLQQFRVLSLKPFISLFPAQ